MMPSSVTDAPTMPVAASERELHRAEQPLEQPRLLEQQPHEDEERHRGERLLAHYLEELVDHQVEHGVAEADVAEQQPENDEREGDREADEDSRQQRGDHPHADRLRAHG